MDSIITFFQTIIDFLSSQIQGFVNLFLLIPRAATFVYGAITYVPLEIRAFCIAAIGVSIVFLILGR